MHFILNVIITLLTAVLVTFGCGKKEPTYIPAKTDEGNTEQPTASTKADFWVTSGNKNYLFSKEEIELSKDIPTSVVKIDPTTKYQTIDGFGAAMTWASCYNLLKMSEANRTALLKELFDPVDGLGISLIRVSIGASDFNLEEYTWCDKKGIENFAMDSRDKNTVIPVLKEMYKINPDVQIIASPWSTPKWMKMGTNGTGTHNAWTSGRLDPQYYDAYATYFVKWIQAMEAEGFKIMAITIQNEPLNHGNSMSTYMPWEDQRDFIKMSLGKALRDAGLKTKILVFDHNYNYDGVGGQDKYPLHIYDDPDAAQYVDGSAWHNYGGNVNELDAIHAAAPEKSIYFTEASIGEWNYNFGSCLVGDFRSIFLGTLERYGKGVTLWNMVLDDQKGPYSPQSGSCKTCYGAVEVSKSTYNIVDRKTHYYNIAHASKVVKPGAVRIGTNSNCNTGGLVYQAYQNPDGSYGLLLLNSGGKNIDITFASDKNAVSVTVPATSIASLLWKD